MDNANDIIAANIQSNLQHVAEVQQTITEPKTAEQWQDLIQTLLGSTVDFCLRLISSIMRGRLASQPVLE